MTNEQQADCVSRMSATFPHSGPAATLVADCKRQLRSTAQWERICQTSEDCISPQLSQRGQLSEVTEKERMTVMEQAKRQLARDGQLAELKAAVRQMLTQALSHSTEPRDGNEVASGSQQGGGADGSAARPTRSGGPTAGGRQEAAVEVCRYLLLKCPHLTKQLSRYVLCPFPSPLRPVLWGWCLQHGSVGKRLAGDSQQDRRVPFGPSQLAARCRAALSSSPLLSMVQQWPHTLRVMVEAVESLPPEGVGCEGVECVLVLPFVYVHMGSVQQGVSWEEAKESVVRVVEHYGLFMRCRPWHLCSATLPVARDAAAMFCGKVNRLLISADPELHSSLCSSLAPPPTEEGPPSSTQDQFVHALREVLHTLMAQFFVGTVPLSVVCVLMDQHLLSLVLPGYEPLPFCVAGLLLLSRRELLRCRNMDQVQSALRQQGPRITPQALLSKVKQWFAGEVSQQVKASHAKFTLREDDQETAALRQQVYSLEALVSASSPSQSAPGEASRSRALASQRLESQPPRSGGQRQSHTQTGSAQRSARRSSQRLASGSNQGSVAGSNQGSVAGSNQGSVAGSNQGSVAGSNQGSVAGRNQGSVAASNQGSVAGSNQGSVAGRNQGSVAGSNQVTSMRAEYPQGGSEDPLQSGVDTRHLSPSSNAPSPHMPLPTTGGGQGRGQAAVTDRPSPLNVPNLVSVTVARGPPLGPRSPATVAQSHHAVLQDAIVVPLEGLPLSLVMQHTLSPTASSEQVDGSPNRSQTPPPSYPSTAAGRTGTPDPVARSRAQEFWLHVLSHFSDALYLLFHGPEEDARELERQLAADQDSVESL